MRGAPPARPGARSAPPLVACSRTEDLPLSFAQQRLWFIEQLEPGRASYNVSFLFRLTGPLNVDALRRALAAIVERHEVLRTSFPEALGQPRQVIAPPQEVPLAIERLASLPEGERHAVEARARSEAQR